MDTVEEIELDLELEGFSPGSPEFERLKRARLVLRCQEQRELPHCFSCQAYMFCKLAKSYLRDEREKARQEGAERGKQHGHFISLVAEVEGRSPISNLSPTEQGEGEDE